MEDIFSDVVDKEAVDQHCKREFLRDLIESGSKIPGKTLWTLKRLECDDVIDKLYDEFNRTKSR